jgi:hypothetical protein
LRKKCSEEKKNEERWKSEDGKRATGTIEKRRKVEKEGYS